MMFQQKKKNQCASTEKINYVQSPDVSDIVFASSKLQLYSATVTFIFQNMLFVVLTEIANRKTTKQTNAVCDLACIFQ